MERLTKRNKQGEACASKLLHLMALAPTSEGTLTEILEKLAGYEDLEEKAGKDIDEADRIAYGNDTPPSDGGVFELQTKASEVINSDDSVIYNPKAIIIKTDRLLAKALMEDIEKQFDGTGIKCIFICGSSGVDYIC